MGLMLHIARFVPVLVWLFAPGTAAAGTDSNPSKNVDQIRRPMTVPSHLQGRQSLAGRGPLGTIPNDIGRRSRSEFEPRPHRSTDTAGCLGEAPVKGSFRWSQAGHLSVNRPLASTVHHPGAAPFCEPERRASTRTSTLR